ncbi:hypothetical protein MSPP1_003019 [Malassezia sp. CBS 17886]|nr:hypothetical protein MSPP1_003019 [Malassezia sp. CBS 17886]
MPVLLSLKHITSMSLATAGGVLALQWTGHADGADGADGIDKWDAERYGRGRLPRIDDELRELLWGDVRYQGHTKLSPPEPNYSADWGDWIAFAHHMRQRAEERGVDLLFVDTGDLHDGNGLSDAFPALAPGDPHYAYAVNGHVSNQVFALADYDVLTIGNHELYNFSVARDVYEHFVPKWNGRYVTSNVNISLPDAPNNTDAPAARSRPIGSLYTRFTTPRRGLVVQAYGVLFDFRLAAKGISVQDPVEMAGEPWFLESLRTHADVDVFVIAGHMPVTGHAGWDALHAAIREVWPTAPIIMLGGHTHVRDCRMMDARAMALESGRYLETIGWMSVRGVRGRAPEFSRRYIDANPRNYAFHAGLAHAGQLSTARGRFVRLVMDRIAQTWNLTHVYGLVPTDYFLDRFAYGTNHSLLTLLAHNILPSVVGPSSGRDAAAPRIMLINSGSQRFDLLAGPLTKNDQYIVSPFRDLFLYLERVPWGLARRLEGALNARGASANEDADTSHGRSDVHASQGDADSIFHAYQLRQFLSYWTRQRDETREADASHAAPPPALSGRPEQARRVEQMLRETQVPRDAGPTPSLGYVTVDACPGDGDDTRHTPVPYSDEQPDYVASAPSRTLGDDEEIDVVFVDFILDPIVRLLNEWDAERAYDAAEARPWGNVSTQWLYPLYAEYAWRQGLAEEWHDMDVAARLHGYPPLSQYDTYAGYPYDAVVHARANVAPLVFQGGGLGGAA